MEPEATEALAALGVMVAMAVTEEQVERRMDGLSTAPKHSLIMAVKHSELEPLRPGRAAVEVALVLVGLEVQVGTAAQGDRVGTVAQTSKQLTARPVPREGQEPRVALGRPGTPELVERPIRIQFVRSQFALLARSY